MRLEGGSWYWLLPPLSICSCGSIADRVVAERSSSESFGGNAAAAAASSTGGKAFGGNAARSGSPNATEAGAGEAGADDASPSAEPAVACDDAAPFNVVTNATSAYWIEDEHVVRAALPDGPSSLVDASPDLARPGPFPLVESDAQALPRALGLALSPSYVLVGFDEGVGEVSMQDSKARGLAAGQPRGPITARGGFVYWTGASSPASGDVDGGPIWRLSEEAMGEQPSLVAYAPSPGALAVDESSVYFAEAERGGALSVSKTSQGGGTPVTLLQVREPSFAADPWLGIALTTEFIFVAFDRSIFKVPKAGGIARRLAHGSSSLQGIVSDGDVVYWASCSGRITKYEVPIYKTTVLAQQEKSPILGGVDDHNVYWVAKSGSFWRLRHLSK